MAIILLATVFFTYGRHRIRSTRIKLRVVNNNPSAIAPDVCVIYLQLRLAISMLTEPFLDK